MVRMRVILSVAIAVMAVVPSACGGGEELADPTAEDMATTTSVDDFTADDLERDLVDGGVAAGTTADPIPARPQVAGCEVQRQTEDGTHVIRDAGEIVVQLDDGTPTLVEVRPAPAWEVSVDEGGDGPLLVRFGYLSREVVATVLNDEADSLLVEICENN